MSQVISPILLGRDADIATLMTQLAQCSVGQGNTLLISGEAGIGKSRLVNEARTRAQSQSYCVLIGNCYEVDYAVPYGPFIDLLRRFCIGKSRDEIANIFSGTTQQLVTLLPELITSHQDLLAKQQSAPEQEKRKLFAGISTFLSDIARTQPVLVVIEDLHWCDDMSLEFLVLLARMVRSQRMLLLLTYRNDEVTATLTHFLAQLERERLATDLILKRLSINHVEGIIAAIFDQQHVRSEFSQTIYNLTNGNPFFVEETLKSLVVAGDIYFKQGVWTRKALTNLHIPHTVHDAVQRRAQRLTPLARSALNIAAIIGQHFEFELLQQLTGHDEATLLKLIKEMLVVQLVVEIDADAYDFRHALTRQAISSTLLTRERRAIHRMILRALENLHSHKSADEYVENLSYHAHEAQDWAKSDEYGYRAGKKARRMYAPRAVDIFLSRAIEAVNKQQTVSTTHISEIYYLRAQAREQLGEFEDARGDYEIAKQAAQTAENIFLEWQAGLGLGFLWASRDYVHAGDYFRDALMLAPKLGNPSLAAQTLNRVGNWHMNAEQPFEGIRYHTEALLLFEALGDKQGIASTLDLMGISHYVSGEFHQSINYYAQAVTLLRELNDKSGLITALAIGSSRGIAWFGRTVLPTQSHLHERIAECEEALRLSNQVEARPGVVISQLWMGFNYAMSGQYTKALQQLQQGLIAATEIEHKHFICTAHMLLGVWHWDVAAWEIAILHLQQALTVSRETNSTIWKHNIIAFFVSALVQMGKLERAEQILHSEWNPQNPLQGIGFRAMWGAYAELLLAQGDAVAAMRVIDVLVDTMPKLASQPNAVAPYLAYLYSEVFCMLGQHSLAIRWAEQGQAAAHLYDLPALQWRLAISLGKALLANGKRDKAAFAFTYARDLAGSLTQLLEDSGLRDNLLKAATVTMARVSLDSPRRKAKAQFDGLTMREREVASRIGQGLSNRAIAEQLSLSERTIETHAANILSKLGFTSRSQIAVWAHEKDLA